MAQNTHILWATSSADTRNIFTEEVSEMLAVSLGSIYNWHSRWRRESLAGLANKAKSGRPKKADQVYCDLLEQTVAHEPNDYGYGFGIWTVNRSREHLRLKQVFCLVIVGFVLY
ncbi:MAG: helix-turn-helix domain-containing protein [Anaerolineae bacterium]